MAWGLVVGLRNMATSEIQILQYLTHFNGFQQCLDYPLALHVKQNRKPAIYSSQDQAQIYEFKEYLPTSSQIYNSRLTPSLNAFLFFTKKKAPVLHLFNRDTLTYEGAFTFESSDFFDQAIVGGIHENVMVFLSQSGIAGYSFQNGLITQKFYIQRNLKLNVRKPQFIQFTQQNEIIHASFVSDGTNLLTLTYSDGQFSLQERYSYHQIQTGFIISGSAYALISGNRITSQFFSERPAQVDYISDETETQTVSHKSSIVWILIGVSTVAIGFCALVTILVRSKARRRRQRRKVQPRERSSKGVIIIEVNTIEDCCICLEQVLSHGVVTKCKHTYHSKCLQKWLTSRHSCPVCRARIVRFPC